MQAFSESRASPANIYEQYGFSESKRFDLREAQRELRQLRSFSQPIIRILHRPFDERYLFFHQSVVWSMSRPMAEQMQDDKNIALVATRQVTRPQFEHAFVSRHIIEIKACSHDRNTQIFPLFLRQGDGELKFGSEVGVNLNAAGAASLRAAVLENVPAGKRTAGADVEFAQRAFNYVYAVLHSPEYRRRYFPFLRSDFPRIPLSPTPKLFDRLCDLGAELTSYHLLEASALSSLRPRYSGPANPEVEKVSFERKTIWLSRDRTVGFHGVAEDVWEFRIGGYQVCDKWLKDRRGERLAKADVEHFERILKALEETLRLMAEVDCAIDEHGGWPGAFGADVHRTDLPESRAPEASGVQHAMKPVSAVPSRERKGAP
jgi:predicted helicase